MKNQKFCFNKGVGLITLIGIVLVGFILASQMVISTKTSTNSRAAASKTNNSKNCGLLGQVVCPGNTIGTCNAAPYSTPQLIPYQNSILESGPMCVTDFASKDNLYSLNNTNKIGDTYFPCNNDS